MKQAVKISPILTILSSFSLLIILGTALYVYRDLNPYTSYLLFATAIAISLLSLFYMPLSISVDDRELCINRSLKIKSIPLADIESIEILRPRFGERRICGSKGLFGYWGWYYHRDFGKYFSYYGNTTDCFFVTLKNGRKYMLGCQNPQTIVDHIKKRLA